MNRRERLMATMRGEPVDRPAVSFYELNGLDENPLDADPFNIYSDPSWTPLLQLTREKTDRMVLRGVLFRETPTGEPVPLDPLRRLAETRTWLDESGRRLTERTIRTPDRRLRSLTRRDPDINTVWTIEHLLKTADDMRALLDLPWPADAGQPDVAPVLAAEAALGDTGIVVLDTPDPLCMAADLFEMGRYTMVALREQALFHELLSRYAAIIHQRTETVAQALPGRLWRVFGPEYASPPYLPPRLFAEYVVRYDRPMVESIHRHGGFCRLHSHGNLRAVLDDIVSTDCMGLDPIEPPPQGDVELSYVRERYGDQFVLFGNLEISDIENLSPDEMERKTRKAIAEGTAGHGRGFVLMPSACPYGRHLPQSTLANYERIIDVVESL
ncbi:MAG: hypothetical protein JXO22_09195 [Phycisphaerae bacterium]|nr:hypothetical protein [Phycisphaerae bacterium]